MPKLLLFDIDGTLLNVEHQFTKRIIGGVLEQFGILPKHVDAASFAGRTDLGIFRELMGDRFEDRNLFERAKQAYVSAMQTHLVPEVTHLLEGAREVVHQLSSTEHILGLLTGNFKEVAYAKLKMVGLDHYFNLGAFGCQHADRNRLPELARSDAGRHGHEFRANQLVIIGDTPRDIACAQYAGAKCVAVSTGGYSREQLSKDNPDLLLTSLAGAGELIVSL